MNSNYSKYILEREGFSLLEDEKGFASYKVSRAECYIRDIFVLPEFRHLKVASGYCDQISEIAKNQGVKFITGTVYPNASGSSESLMAILKYGFKLISSDHEKIILAKELQ